MFMPICDLQNFLAQKTKVLMKIIIPLLLFCSVVIHKSKLCVQNNSLFDPKIDIPKMRQYSKQILAIMRYPTKREGVMLKNKLINLNLILKNLMAGFKQGNREAIKYGYQMSQTYGFKFLLYDFEKRENEYKQIFEKFAPFNITEVKILINQTRDYWKACDCYDYSKHPECKNYTDNVFIETTTNIYDQIIY